MMIDLSILLSGISLGIAVTNLIWGKLIQNNNHEWCEMLSKMQEDFYRKWGGN